MAALPLDEDGFRTRRVRFLPLSAESDGALRAMARRYLDWLAEPAGEPSFGSAADPVLSDMAWTAGIGRSHHHHRAGVVFRDARSLREGLGKLVKADAKAARRPGGEAARKVAFAYTGEAGDWIRMGRELYRTEPVVRAVMDRCNAVFDQEGAGISLLEAAFGREGTDGGPEDPAWTAPALYAMQCALTALWSSVGITPGVVVGHGLGELAAAQAAGVFGLEDGLRFAAGQSSDQLQGALAGPGPVTMAPPSIVLVSSVTGGVVQSVEELEERDWRRRARESGPIEDCVDTLAELGVHVAVEIGPHAIPDSRIGPSLPEWSEAAGTPVVLECLSGPVKDAAADGAGGFVEAVAGAYELGLAVSFPGLFAGETRRRISLPGYAFQRRSHWVQTLAPADPGAKS